MWHTFQRQIRTQRSENCHSASDGNDFAVLLHCNSEHDDRVFVDQISKTASRSPGQHYELGRQSTEIHDRYALCCINVFTCPNNTIVD